MKHKIPVIAAQAALLLLAGCNYYTKAPWQVTNDLEHRYGNHPVNEFFADYGLPVGEFQHNNGTNVYRWASAEHPAPPDPLHLATYTSPYGHYELVDTFNGTADTHYCELRIYTDSQDNVQRFAVAVDSIGKWSASRCSELFPNP